MGRRRAVLATLLGSAFLAALGFLFPVLLAIRFTADTSTIGPRRVGDLLDSFARHGYELASVAAGETPVPRLFATHLPKDWRALAQADARKRAFIMVVLPLVLQANKRILADRQRLRAIEARLAKGRKLSPAERNWLDGLADGYGLSPKDLKDLAFRLDIVPPSLAIAQAAIESGWGTSRFATEGNALYGQWTEQGQSAIVPAGREPGRTYAIRRFATLGESVASYMRNLNTHRAYRKFRAARAELRRRAAPLDGATLAEKLRSYSEQGQDYVRAVQAIIAKNGLAALDQATLQP